MQPDPGNTTYVRSGLLEWLDGLTCLSAALRLPGQCSASRSWLPRLVHHSSALSFFPWHILARDVGVSYIMTSAGATPQHV